MQIYQSLMKAWEKQVLSCHSKVFYNKQYDNMQG
jgi:hypothetical protein